LFGSSRKHILYNHWNILIKY
jgi:F0F1-type ATP synthase membrane subunit c/vacuolar-type H+-ATPase subunit K